MIRKVKIYNTLTRKKEIFNPKVLRASMGSFFHLNIYDEVYLLDEIEKMRQKGYRIVCADIEGENVYEYRFEKNTCLVFSNESHGPSTDLLALSDTRLTIPRLGRAESLNVASASAVLLALLSKSLLTN